MSASASTGADGVRAAKERLLSVRKMMLRKYESDSLIRGERPARAVPLAVRKSLPALRLATGRGESTGIGLRRAISKWSVGDELFRSPAGGDPVRRTRPCHAGNAASTGVGVGMQMLKSWIEGTSRGSLHGRVALPTETPGKR